MLIKINDNLKGEKMITEIVYKDPNGEEKVLYIEPYNSKEALELINEILDLQNKHKESCPYFFRHVEN